MTHLFVEQLKQHFPNNRFSIAPDQMAPFLSDWRKRFHGNALAVLHPHSRDDLVKMIQLTHLHPIRIFTQGGNTGLVGGGVPDEAANNVLISMKKMNAIRQIDRRNRSMIVEAGCTLIDAQHAAHAEHLHFPLDLASSGSCTIGGNLASNAGGVAVLRYGNMRELCLGLEIVLSDGRVISALKSLRKNNTGLDLKQLFIGSEGTLGIITAASLRLFPRPQHTLTAWIELPSPQCALSFFDAIMQQFDANVTAFELISARCLELTKTYFPEKKIPFHSNWSVLLELSAPTCFANDLEAYFISWYAQNFSEYSLVLAKNQHEVAEFWAIREGFSAAQTREGVSIKHDIALPISRLPEFLDETERRLRAQFPDVTLTIFGHLGDGNLHYNVRPIHDNALILKHEKAVNDIVFQCAYEFDGTLSAEHGIGRLRREQLRDIHDPESLTLMQQLKRALDPHNRLNPDILL